MLETEIKKLTAAITALTAQLATSPKGVEAPKEEKSIVSDENEKPAKPVNTLNKVFDEPQDTKSIVPNVVEEVVEELVASKLVTKQDLIKLCKDMTRISADNRPKVKAIVTSFGVTKVSDMTDEDVAIAYEQISEMGLA